MRKILNFILIAFCFTAVAQNSSTLVPQSQIYITHVNVIDTETGKEATDQTVVISDGKIADVSKSKNLAVPASARIVDGRGKYVIPGLWDMHVHTFTFFETGTGTAPSMPPDMYFRLAIANGVTGFREMGGPETPEDLAKLRQAASNGSALVPKLFTAGPVLDGAKPTWPQHSISVNTEQEGRKAVQKIKAAGFDFVKVYSGLSREAYHGIAEESHAQGISFVGHVPSSITALEASNAGQKSIEHFTRVLTACSGQEHEIDSMFQDAVAKGQSIFPLIAKAQQMQLASYDPGKAKILYATFAKNRTWQVPTFAQQRSFAYLDDPTFRTDPRLKYIPAEVQKSWDPQADFRMKYRTPDDWKLAKQVYEKYFDIASEMHRQGVHFLAGTDLVNAYIFPGFSLHDELGLLVKAGLSNVEALQAATWNPAIFMNATDKYGSVAPGKIADLVLLDADPLKDIRNTTKISEVFLSGKEFDRQALDRMLRSAEEQATEEVKPASQETANHPSAAPSQDTETPQPSPEMQRLFSAQLGKWSQRLQRPDGSSGEGEAVWRPGPGGKSLVENEYIWNDTGDLIGLSVTWWDKAVEGYRALWCDNKIKDGCLVMSQPAHWQGDEFVLRDEFERDGKKFVYKEVESQITPSTYTLTSYTGEPGGEIKPTSTIHATRIPEGNTESSSAAEAELRALMAERRKASIEGDTEKIASSLAEEYVQTDITGYIQDKATWLKEYFIPLSELIKAGKFRWEVFEEKDIQIRIYGDAATVIGSLELKGSGARVDRDRHTWVVGEARPAVTLRFTRIYIKRDGKWLLAALHNQLLQPSPPVTSSAGKLDFDPNPQEEIAVQQVLAADEARRLAMLHSDVSALDSLLADDVTSFWGDGTADDKASTLALLRSGRLRYSQLDYEKTQVRLYGKTAVVTGQARVKERSDSEGRSYLVRVTRVYAHQQDRWHLVASQTTRVRPMP